MRRLKSRLYKTKINLKNLFALVAIVSAIFLFSAIPAYVNLLTGIFIFIGWAVWMTAKANRAAKTYINERGYVVLVAVNDLEHRYIAKQLLNRELKPNEVVHHINGRKTDNAIHNLCLMDSHKHELFHSWLTWKKQKMKRYPHFHHQKKILVQDYDGILLEQVVPEKSIDLQKPIEVPEANVQGNHAYDSNLLFEQLRKERLRIAREEKKPAYMIFYDKTLLRMAHIVPDNDATMLNTIGPTKYQRYGPAFISVIKKFKANNSEQKKRVSS